MSRLDCCRGCFIDLSARQALDQEDRWNGRCQSDGQIIRLASKKKSAPGPLNSGPQSGATGLEGKPQQHDQGDRRQGGNKVAAELGGQDNGQQNHER